MVNNTNKASENHATAYSHSYVNWVWCIENWSGCATALGINIFSKNLLKASIDWIELLTLACLGKLQLECNDFLFFVETGKLESYKSIRFVNVNFPCQNKSWTNWWFVSSGVNCCRKELLKKPYYHRNLLLDRLIHIWFST